MERKDISRIERSLFRGIHNLINDIKGDLIMNVANSGNAAWDLLSERAREITPQVTN
jgi:hypothetical protein